MVNIGGLVGPIIAGKLRVISWNYAFLASAIAIAVMLIVTIFFYKEPPRQIEGQTLKNKFKDLGIALSDGKFLVFLLLLGVFFWLPFWAFFNLIGLYIDQNLDTASLYTSLKSVLGAPIANFVSQPTRMGYGIFLASPSGTRAYILSCFSSWYHLFPSALRLSLPF